MHNVVGIGLKKAPKDINKLELTEHGKLESTSYKDKRGLNSRTLIGNEKNRIL